MKINLTQILISAGIIILIILLILNKNKTIVPEKIYITDTIEKPVDKVIYKTLKPKYKIKYKYDTIYKPEIFEINKNNDELEIYSKGNDTLSLMEKYKINEDFRIISKSGGIEVQNKNFSFEGAYLSSGILKNISTKEEKYYIGIGLSGYIYDVKLSAELKYDFKGKNYLAEVGIRIYF